MAGTEWEAERKSYGKRIIISLVIVIAAVVVIGVFFYNNRDFFTHSTKSVVAEKTEEPVATQVVDTPVTVDSGSIDSTLKIFDRASDTIVQKPSEIQAQLDVKKADSEFFVILPEFECRTFDRSDLRLKMSLKLFFPGEVQLKDVVLLRSDVKVVVQRLVKEMELRSIKKEHLKSEILQAANKMLGRTVFSDVQYIDFKIEKVSKE